MRKDRGGSEGYLLGGSSQLTCRPGKINILNLKNGGSEGVRPFQFGDFRLHVNVQGCKWLVTMVSF